MDTLTRRMVQYLECGYEDSTHFLALGFIKDPENINMDNYQSVIEHYKTKSLDWFMPWINLTLRTSRTNADTYTKDEKESDKGSGSEYINKLNRVLDVPKHAQDGPQPKSNPPGDTLSQRLTNGLTDQKYLQYQKENYLVVFHPYSSGFCLLSSFFISLFFIVFYFFFIVIHCLSGRFLVVH